MASISASSTSPKRRAHHRQLDRLPRKSGPRRSLIEGPMKGREQMAVAVNQQTLCRPLRFPKSGFSPSRFPETCQSTGQPGEAAHCSPPLLPCTGKHLTPRTCGSSSPRHQSLRAGQRVFTSRKCLFAWSVLSVSEGTSLAVRTRLASLGGVCLRGPQLGGLCPQLAQPGPASGIELKHPDTPAQTTHGSAVGAARHVTRSLAPACYCRPRLLSLFDAMPFL